MEQVVEALIANPVTAVLDARRSALVRYAAKLTQTPSEMCEGDVASLRAVGLSDEAIHDAAGITAYFNFVNRMASGLGVELERGN
jgi:uncharacterized peroxidase-related enzyme